MRALKKNNPGEPKRRTIDIPEKLLTPVEPTLVTNMERVVELVTTLHLGEAFNSAALAYGYDLTAPHHALADAEAAAAIALKVL